MKYHPLRKLTDKHATTAGVWLLTSPDATLLPSSFDGTSRKAPVLVFSQLPLLTHVNGGSLVIDKRSSEGEEEACNSNKFY